MTRRSQWREAFRGRGSRGRAGWGSRSGRAHLIELSVLVDHRADVERATADEHVLVDVLVPDRDAQLLAHPRREDGAHRRVVLEDWVDRASVHLGLRTDATGLDDDKGVGLGGDVLDGKVGRLDDLDE